MKAKIIKAMDAVIAGLEDWKEALEDEASKSGSGSDDEDTGKVSRSKNKAKADGVSAKGKQSRNVPDDDDDVDGADDDSGDNGDEDDLPPAKAAVKDKAKAAAAAKTTKGKSKDKKELTLEAVKEKLTEVMTHESLGKKKVLAILKKFGAAKSVELEESDYAGVVKACTAALAEAEEASDDDSDDV